MKRDQTIIRKNLMEQLSFITNLLGIKDKNIIILNYLDSKTHKEIIAKLDYPAPKCHNCHGQMAKYDFQKESKIPYLECAGYKTLIRLRKRRFRCKACGKMAVVETSLVKKNHQISTIVNQKITQKLIEKVPMTVIAESLSVSTSTVFRKLKEFKFKTDLSFLPTHMSWDEYGFKKGNMSFIAQDFDSRKIVAILDGRTQVTIRNHFLRYSRQVRSLVKVITMDMFSPYYDIARKLFPNAKIVLDRFHIVQHLSRAMNRLRIQIMNQFNRKSHEYKAMKRYRKLIQQDSRKLSDKRFYRPTFWSHLTNKEILEKILPYSNAKLEATNNLIKVIKRNAFGFRNFDNFNTRILIALNIKKERTNLVLSRV